MLFRKLMSVLLCAVFLISSMGTTLAATPDTVQDKLTAIETDTYGSEQTGALIDRAVTDRLGAKAQDLPLWGGLSARFTTATRLEAAFWGLGRA